MHVLDADPYSNNIDSRAIRSCQRLNSAAERTAAPEQSAPAGQQAAVVIDNHTSQREGVELFQCLGHWRPSKGAALWDSIKKTQRLTNRINNKH